MGSLTASGKPSPMTRSSITVDIHQTLDIQLHLFAEITLDPAPILNDLANASRFLFGQFLDHGIHVDLSLIQDRSGT
jgi:acyl dehydratase